MAKKKTGEPIGRPPFDEEHKMERVTIGLPGPILDKLKREAIARNISFSLIIREKLKKAGV
jgi:predicted DNA binding CopG/RHH family protein